MKARLRMIFVFLITVSLCFNIVAIMTPVMAQDTQVFVAKPKVVVSNNCPVTRITPNNQINWVCEYALENTEEEYYTVSAEYNKQDEMTFRNKFDKFQIPKNHIVKSAIVEISMYFPNVKSLDEEIPQFIVWLFDTTSNYSPHLAGTIDFSNLHTTTPHFIGCCGQGAKVIWEIDITTPYGYIVDDTFSVSLERNDKNMVIEEVIVLDMKTTLTSILQEPIVENQEGITKIDANDNNGAETTEDSSKNPQYLSGILLIVFIPIIAFLSCIISLYTINRFRK